MTDWGLDVAPLEEYSETENMGLTRLGLAISVSSSKSAILDSIDRAIEKVGSMNYSDPEETKNDFIRLKNMIVGKYDDRKYDSLIEYISSRPKEKVLIFVAREATRDELVRRLTSDLNRSTEGHNGRSQKAKKRIRFAPVAHNQKVKKKDQIDILVILITFQKVLICKMRLDC